MRHPTDFHVTIERAQAEVTVAIVGELDLFTARELHRSLAKLDRGAPTTIVDLGRLTFIDVAGLRALEMARDDLARTGTSVRFANPPRAFTRIAEILDLDLDLDLDLGDFRV